MYYVRRPLGILFMIACMAAVLAGCEEVPQGQFGGRSGQIPPAQCAPNDQDQFVYHPNRLQVLQSCIHVSGTVIAVRTENDGDRHIQLALDSQYQYLLQPANRFERGDLVIEPVCASLPIQPDALNSCAGDADPLLSVPSVGQHVWMEGRYALDREHGNWAEIHPLYRWGAGTAMTPDQEHQA
jgi:hypothetical protein